MKKVLSFIIPSYNCERFLDKCVTSMLCTEVLDKLDIIIVNDGSSDTTSQIAQSYCDRYPGSVRLISQENKGHGGALNTGCEAAMGKYLKVIDADDWVETDNLPAFVRFLENCDSDVVLTHHYTINISNGEIKKWKTYPQTFEKAYTFEEIMPQWGNFSRSLTFHGITYSTVFYQQNTRGLSEHVFYEDHEYATIPCCLAKSVTPLDMFVYHYRIGDVEQSVSQANQLKRLHHMEAVLNRLLEESSVLSLEGPNRVYYCRKVRDVLLSYITTVMLVMPDRKYGRTLGKKAIAAVQEQLPEAYETAKKQCKVFAMMNWLHIRKEAWDKILTSSLYRKLKHDHNFD